MTYPKYKQKFQNERWRTDQPKSIESIKTKTILNLTYIDCQPSCILKILFLLLIRHFDLFENQLPFWIRNEILM